MAISKKQMQIMAFPFTHYDAIICDGAIRSGKTVFMTMAFVDWGMREFNNQRFAICGKTVDSTVKNIIEPYTTLTYAQQRYQLKWRSSEKVLKVSNGTHTNYFEVFGGKDESSYTLIQGRTLAGVLLDEVALQPQSFVQQALARCSVEGSKFWFNCNPDSPQHWFYKEWVQHPEAHNALRLHFQLEDNPSLSEKKIQQYHSMFHGVFYQRYILGMWVVAEGLIYDFGEANITDEEPHGGEYYISIDYGTLNPFSAGVWRVVGAQAVRVKEYYYSGRETTKQRTDEEYCDEIDKLVKSLEYEDEQTGELVQPKIKLVVVDPSAASFITALQRRHYHVQKANNDVLDGIRNTATYLANGNIKIHRSCTNCIEEFGLYRWDEKASEDKVIKENDHAMDDVRYFCNTIMKNKVHKTKYNSVMPYFMGE